MKIRFLLVSFVLIITIFGCGESQESIITEETEDNMLAVEKESEWIGTWEIQSVDGLEFDVELKASELFLALFAEFEEDNEESKLELTYSDVWVF